MAKSCSFDAQSCLGMVWDLGKNLDFLTILTHFDPGKGTLAIFGNFVFLFWIFLNEVWAASLSHILHTDSFEPKHGIFRTDDDHDHDDDDDHDHDHDHDDHDDDDHDDFFFMS